MWCERCVESILQLSELSVSRVLKFRHPRQARKIPNMGLLHNKKWAYVVMGKQSIKARDYI